MEQMEIPTLSDGEEKRPVKSKKSSKATKKIRAGKLAKEYIMDKVEKAARQMIDGAAEDDGADDDGHDEAELNADDDADTEPDAGPEVEPDDDADDEPVALSAPCRPST
jgi:hypothetical protein